MTYIGVCPECVFSLQESVSEVVSHEKLEGSDVVSVVGSLL